jgi:hypothetical protein
MALIRSIFWFTLFIAATFTFTVIFEHGFNNFSKNAEKEFHLLRGYVTGKVKRPIDTSDKLETPEKAAP